MLHRSNQSKIWTLLFSIGFLISPVVAHEMETSNDVGVTFHIDPNHNPTAGIASKAWFALTRKGGEVIPLEKCDCHLAVYPEPHEEGKTPPLLKPDLYSTDVEKYQGIPAADITFPKAGTYELELTGDPINKDDFQHFEFSFSVTAH